VALHTLQIALFSYLNSFLFSFNHPGMMLQNTFPTKFTNGGGSLTPPPQMWWFFIIYYPLAQT
jgi:hypothetical protein